MAVLLWFARLQEATVTTIKLESSLGELVSVVKTIQSKFFFISPDFHKTECGLQGVPGIYANVAMVRSWIDTKMTEKGLGVDSYSYGL